MATPIPHVLLGPDGTAINRLLLVPDSDWQPPAGHSVQADPDGSLWAAAATPLPEPPIPADWDAFKRELLSSAEVKDALAFALLSEPTAALALPATLLAAANGGDTNDFRAAWLQLRRQNLMPQPLLDQLSALAQQCHLPDTIVRTIGGQL